MPAQGRPSGGDGAGGDQHHLGPLLPELAQLADYAAQDSQVDAPVAVGVRRLGKDGGARLDHNALVLEWSGAFGREGNFGMGITGALAGSGHEEATVRFRMR